MMKKVIKRMAKLAFFRLIYPAYYFWCARRPIEPNKVLFIELMSDRLTNSFQAYVDRLTDEYTFDVEVLLLNQLRMRYRKKIGLNFMAIKRLATARYVFIDNTLPIVSACPIRKGTVVVQTWHGCGAFKKFGYSLVKGETESSGWDYKMYPLHAHYSHVFVSGKEAVDPYIDAFGMEAYPERVQPIGVSRTDVFFQPESLDSARKKVLSVIPEAQSKRVLLYAPTYRRTVTHACLPAELDFELMRKHLGEEWVLLIKLHSFIKHPPDIPLSCSNFAFNVTDQLEIQDLLIVADECISDYSSVVFEYSLLERPIMFYVPDIAEYYYARGFYYDFHEFACGPICMTTQDLLQHIGRADKDALDRVRAFRERFMDGCDGQATERILQRVFGEALHNQRRRVS